MQKKRESTQVGFFLHPDILFSSSWGSQMEEMLMSKCKSVKWGAISGDWRTSWWLFGYRSKAGVAENKLHNVWGLNDEHLLPLGQTADSQTTLQN